MPCWCWPATSPPPRRGRWSRNISARSRAARSTVPAQADVPTLAAAKSIVMKDRVAAVQMQRHWAVPGPAVGRSLPRSTSAARSSAASPARGSTRSWCATRSSRSAVTAGLQPFQRIGMFEVTATVKPGVDPARRRAAARRDHRRISSPTARPRTKCAAPRRSEVAGRIRGLEQVGGFGGKAVALAEGQVYAGDCDFYKKTLDAICGGDPGRRPRGDAAMAEPPGVHRPARAGRPPALCRSQGPPRPSKSADIATPQTVARAMPPIGATPPLDFPDDRSMSRCRTASRSPTRSATAVPVDPGRAVVRRRLRGRRAGRARPAEPDHRPARRGRRRHDLAADRRGAGAARRGDRRRRAAPTARTVSLSALTRQSRRRRSTCWPTSSSGRPSPRPRSSGSAPRR